MRRCWHRWDRRLLAELLQSRCAVALSGCWEWTGQRSSQGYGRLRVMGRWYGAHVISAWVWLGYDLKVDRKHNIVRHACDNPCCINPDHLDPGTAQQNVADSFTRGGRTRYTTHCIRGHLRTSATTAWSTGRMRCKTCSSENQRKHKLRNKERLLTYDTDTDSYRTAA